MHQKDKKPTELEQFFKAATERKHILPKYIEMESVPLMELSSLAENVHVKTWKN